MGLFAPKNYTLEEHVIRGKKRWYGKCSICAKYETIPYEKKSDAKLAMGLHMHAIHDRK